MQHLKTILSVLFILIECYLVYLALLLSPYGYNWEPTIRQNDDDALLVLRLLCFAIIVVSASGYFLSIKNVRWLRSIHLIVFLYGVFKLGYSFFIS